MNKMLGMSLLVMLVSGFNLFSMERPVVMVGNSEEFQQVIKYAVQNGKNVGSHGSRLSAIMEQKKGKQQKQQTIEQQDKINRNKRKCDGRIDLDVDLDVAFKKTKSNDGQ